MKSEGSRNLNKSHFTGVHGFIDWPHAMRLGLHVHQNDSQAITFWHLEPHGMVFLLSTMLVVSVSRHVIGWDGSVNSCHTSTLLRCLWGLRTCLGWGDRLRRNVDDCYSGSQFTLIRNRRDGRYYQSGAYPICSKWQHVFMHGRSCFTNLLNASGQWTRALDKKAGVDVIYFDFKKAFDCVPHLRMRHKLNELGVCGRLPSWIQSFLTKRMLRVKVGEQYMNALHERLHKRPLM